MTLVLTLLLLVVMPVGLAFSLMLFVRNNWVFEHRRALLRTPYYERLPSYEAMLWRWWVWDINKFIGPPPNTDLSGQRVNPKD